MVTKWAKENRKPKKDEYIAGRTNFLAPLFISFVLLFLALIVFNGTMNLAMLDRFENILNNHTQDCKFLSNVSYGIPDGESVSLFCKEKGYRFGWLNSNSCGANQVMCNKVGFDNGQIYDCLNYYEVAK